MPRHACSRFEAPVTGRPPAAARWSARRAPVGLVAGTLIATAACTLAIGTAAARSDEALGAIIQSSGEALVMRPAVLPQPLRPGMPIRSGDRLVTRADGRVAVRLADGSVIALHPNTEFPVDDERFHADERRGVFSLLRGALRSVSGLVGRRAREQARQQPSGGTSIGRRVAEPPVVAAEPPCETGACPGAAVALVSVPPGEAPGPR
jgi:hypothetical protein